jgi:hypothetical protein
MTEFCRCDCGGCRSKDDNGGCNVKEEEEKSLAGLEEAKVDETEDDMEDSAASMAAAASRFVVVVSPSCTRKRFMAFQGLHGSLSSLLLWLWS